MDYSFITVIGEYEVRKHPAYWFITAILILTLGEGCVKDEVLPEPVVDRSECAKCRMLISDTRYASMLKTSEYLMFDDLGCMLKYEQAIAPQTSKGRWVRDYFTDRWTPIDEAIFYRIENISTPMEYGYIAASKKNPEPPSANEASSRLESASSLADDFAQRYPITAQ